MALIDQQEAAKQIRGNKEYVADCEWLKGYNKACEDNAQIVEQMKGAEEVEAIPVEWIINFKNSTKAGALMGPKEVIKFMLEAWKEEQNEAD